MKCPAEGAVIVETTFLGNFGDAHVGLAKESRGSGQAGLGEELARGEIEETVDESGQLGWRQPGPPRQDCG